MYDNWEGRGVKVSPGTAAYYQKAFEMLVAQISQKVTFDNQP
jgi:hypothetical protein